MTGTVQPSESVMFQQHTKEIASLPILKPILHVLVVNAQSGFRFQKLQQNSCKNSSQRWLSRMENFTQHSLNSQSDLGEGGNYWDSTQNKKMKAILLISAREKRQKDKRAMSDPSQSGWADELGSCPKACNWSCQHLDLTTAANLRGAIIPTSASERLSLQLLQHR